MKEEQYDAMIDKLQHELVHLVSAVTNFNPVGIEISKKIPEKKASAKEAASTDSIESNIDWLRLYIKYLLFDLEVTRREARRLQYELDAFKRKKK